MVSSVDRVNLQQLATHTSFSLDHLAKHLRSHSEEAGPLEQKQGASPSTTWRRPRINKRVEQKGAIMNRSSCFRVAPSVM
mmetsp:Transcript_116572/g.182188  ORF Transcript_116572/g.182188 Transcript_116572/m.182188 type:complete len:80 (-) Transcript_116572:19-258(-)